MAYVEVWKSGQLVTRRRVDEGKAQSGCRVRLGSAGEVRVAIGESKTLGNLEVRVFAGDPPEVQPKAKSEAPAQEDIHARATLDFSADAASSGTGRMGVRPDIEGYKIIEPLGEGGMGMVWRAEQLSTKRQVALKLLVSGRIDSAKAQARFQREVELTARLDHPNIARIYDSGLHQGMYYYAMELIEGVPLDRYVKDKGLSKNQILALMQKVCEAVLYAHLRAVIHRDLKPSNVLVSADGQPHVLDFGLAKGLLEEEALTVSIEGQIAGTPAYMSPEQAAGRHSELDTRTDVYSLGVILYELLTGQSPHDQSGSVFDVLLRITEGRVKRPREASKSIDAELEAILLKALALKPDERYASAGALAKDIASYLDEEPLDARVPTTLYFLRKKARKYRVQVGVATAVSVLLFGTIFVVYTRGVAQKAVREAQATELEWKSKKLTWAELELKALSSNKEEALAALGILRDEYVSAQDEIGRLNHKLGEKVPPVAVRRIDLQPGAALTSTALVRAPSLPGGVKSWTLETLGHRGSIKKLAYSSDGKHLISASSDGTIRTWDAESGRLTQIFVDPNGTADVLRPAGGNAGQFSWSAGDTTRTTEEIIKLWAVDLPEVWQSSLRTATAVAVHPDRSMLAFGDHDGMIRALDLKGGRLRHTQTPTSCGPIQSIRFSPDGRFLATATGKDGTVFLWDAHTWQPLYKRQICWISSSGVTVMAWSPDSSVLAVGGDHQNFVAMLDVQSGIVLDIVKDQQTQISCVSWSPDGHRLVTGHPSGTLELWEVGSRPFKLLRSIDAHSAKVSALAWTLDSRRLFSAGYDGMVKQWNPETGQLLRGFNDHKEPVMCLEVSPDGTKLISGGKDDAFRLWDIQSLRPGRILINRPRSDGSLYHAVAWSPDGAILATGSSTGDVLLWNSDTGEHLSRAPSCCGGVPSLDWSPDGRLLACSGSNGTTQVFDVLSGYQPHVVLLPLWGAGEPGMAVNPQGDYRGPPEIAEHLRYVVSTEQGQQTLTPASFKSRFGWVNEPWQVGLYKPGAENVERIYVNAASKGPYDGKTWQTAFCGLQDALSIAQPNTEIWVAAGTYKPDRGTGARTASFHLKNGIRLFGGFAGAETSISQRDPNSNETILSGDLKGDDEPTFVNNDENSYHVVISIQTDPSCLLDGFIITGGNADGPANPDGSERGFHCGGGVYIDGGNPILNNCILRNNSAQCFGGGMYNHGMGSPTLVDCAFIGNAAQEGGGLHILGEECKPILTDCVFNGNNSGAGGAILNAGGQVKLISCIVSNNIAETSGGGIANPHGYFGSGRITAVLSRFVGNISRSGGAMSNGDGCQLAMTSCAFIGNSARDGGALHNGPSSVVLANCMFASNSAEQSGGAIANATGDRSQLCLTNCTLVSNRSGHSGGGIIGFQEVDPNVCNWMVGNCILWGNVDSGHSVESAQIQGGTIVVNHCCIQGWSGALGGVGSLGADPLFLDRDGADNKMGTDDDDLRLGFGSPCINFGDSAALPADTLDLDGDGDPNEPIPFDINGKPRIQGGTVDIGACESN